MQDETLYGACTALPCRCLRDNMDMGTCQHWRSAKSIAGDDPVKFREELEKITEEYGKQH